MQLLREANLGWVVYRVSPPVGKTKAQTPSQPPPRLSQAPFPAGPRATHQDGAHHSNHNAHHACERDEVVPQRENVLRDQNHVAPEEEEKEEERHWTIHGKPDRRDLLPLVLKRSPSRMIPPKNGPGHTTEALPEARPQGWWGLFPEGA